MANDEIKAMFLGLGMLPKEVNPVRGFDMMGNTPSPTLHQASTQKVDLQYAHVSPLGARMFGRLPKGSPVKSRKLRLW